MNDNINIICNFIKNNFIDNNTHSSYISNYKKLLCFLKNNKIDINEMEARIIIDSLPILRKTFDKVYDEINELIILNIKPLELLINTYNKILDDDVLNGSNTTLNMYFNNIKEYNIPTKKEEIDLINKIKNGDLKARELFINSNQRLIIGIARHFLISGLPLEDLIQEGNVGLMIALDRFDPSLEYRFSTYATCWIKEMMILGTLSSSKAICLSTRASRTNFKIKREIDNYYKINGCMPSNEELSKLTGFSIEKINLISNADNIYSLDEKIKPNDKKSESFIDTLSYDETDNINDKIFYNDFINDFNKLNINPRTKKILELRYGLNGEKEHTYTEIGKMYGITRERVRQINDNVMKELKLELIKYGTIE